MLNLFLNLAHAATRVTGSIDSVQLTNPLQVESITDLISQVTRYLVGISAALVVLIIVWAAFQLLLKSDDPGAHKQALERIKWAAIGFGIMLLASGIVSFVVGFLGGVSGGEQVPSYQTPEYIERSTKFGPQPAPF